MRRWVEWCKDLDRILRGEATRLADLRQGEIEIPHGGLSVVILGLGMFYGACMGCFALLREDGPSLAQWIATTLKVPALFFLTLLVTFPSLYVSNALVGSRLTLLAIFRLMIAALSVNLAVLASMGTIMAFFSLTTTSYHFIVLFNVLIFGVSGFLGMIFLLQTLQRLSVVEAESTPPDLPTFPANRGDEAGEIEPRAESVPESEGEPQSGSNADREQQRQLGPLDRLEDRALGKHVKTVFRCWIVIFSLVGAQMGWVLRPFVGNPSLPFEWFRTRQSNFFEGVLDSIVNLF